MFCMTTSILLDHFACPRNAGTLPNATHRVEVSNPVCGDILQLAAVVENGKVQEVRFLCRGCTASIACASLLTEHMQGRDSTSLRELSADSLAAAFGGLPTATFHAAQLAHDALQALLRTLR